MCSGSIYEKALNPNCWKVNRIRKIFPVVVKFKLRPENGSVSQANGAVREEHAREREGHLQRPRGRRENMIYCREC